MGLPIEYEYMAKVYISNCVSDIKVIERIPIGDEGTKTFVLGTLVLEITYVIEILARA